jgi:RES domain-containing protein
MMQPMLAYRISHKLYMHDTSGEGARLFGGRWNPKGLPCIYTSLCISLAILEKLAHAQWPNEMKDLALGTYRLQEEKDIYKVDVTRLKPDWIHDISYTQWLGRQIFEADYTGFLAPSAIVPTEYNLMLQPAKLALGTAILESAELYELDDRLFKK